MFKRKPLFFLFPAIFRSVLTACGGGGIGVTRTAAAPPSTSTNNVNSHTIADIQAQQGWTWCTQKRNGGVCAAGRGIADSSMTPNQKAPSVGGDSSIFWIGGSTPYSNALWWKTLSASNTATHFTYDVYFYMQDSSAPEALEFDANQSYGGVRYTWGTECSYKDTGKWDVWDPKNEVWVTTSVPCKQVSSNAWHHLVWQFEKANGGVHYISVEVDGQTSPVDKYYQPQQNWNTPETNVAFQMDGNFRQQPYQVWLDHLSLTTW